VHPFDPGDVHPVRRRGRVRIWNNIRAVIVEALADAGLPRGFGLGGHRQFHGGLKRDRLYRNGHGINPRPKRLNVCTSSLEVSGIPWYPDHRQEALSGQLGEPYLQYGIDIFSRKHAGQKTSPQPEQRMPVLSGSNLCPQSGQHHSPDCFVNCFVRGTLSNIISSTS